MTKDGGFFLPSITAMISLNVCYTWMCDFMEAEFIQHIRERREQSGKNSTALSISTRTGWRSLMKVEPFILQSSFSSWRPAHQSLLPKNTGIKMVSLYQMVCLGFSSNLSVMFPPFQLRRDWCVFLVFPLMVHFYGPIAHWEFQALLLPTHTKAFCHD